MTPRLPTGDGEVMSRSAPLEGWSYFIVNHNALQEPVTAPRESDPDYFHQRHQARLSGAVSAVCAVCSKTCSSWTSRRRASSSLPWACTWVWSAVTKASRLLSWPFNGWSFSSKSTFHRNPCGVGSWWAVSSPLPMRRRIVSVDTPKRRAASPIDTFSTTFLLFGLGNSIGCRLGACLGVAWAVPGIFMVKRTPATGDGEHLNPLEPVGRPYLGSGAKPQLRGLRAPPLSLYSPREDKDFSSTFPVMKE